MDQVIGIHAVSELRHLELARMQAEERFRIAFEHAPIGLAIASLEGPTDEMEKAGKIVEREMCQAFELDPELAVDVGVGKDWLAAK